MAESSIASLRRNDGRGRMSAVASHLLGVAFDVWLSLRKLYAICSSADSVNPAAHQTRYLFARTRRVFVAD